MNTDQTNRITMMKTVTVYMDGQNAVWNGMAPMGTSVQRLKEKLTAIDTAAQQQETPSGATDNKAATRDALEDVLFLACEALGVIGHTSNDHGLLALTALSPSELGHLGTEELVRRATAVLGEANSRKTELAALHVTQANLDELTQALQNFSDAKEQPRTATAERMAQTESLATLIREANNILRNEIDRMVNLFRRSNPDFVAGYRAARVIVDRAATHSSAKPAGSVPTPKP